MAYNDFEDQFDDVEEEDDNVGNCEECGGLLEDWDSGAVCEDCLLEAEMDENEDEEIEEEYNEQE